MSRIPSVLDRALRFASCLAIFPLLTAPARAAAGATGWVADFQRYAAQDKLREDRSYSTERPDFTFADLLGRLPDPAQWPEVRRALDAAATKATGVEQQRLHAGGWLLAYLAGAKTEVAAALPPAPADPEPGQMEAAFALERVRGSLADRGEEAAGQTPAEQLQEFEQELLSLEPVDLGEVKRVLGGEENFARLQRVLAAGRAMQEKMMQVYEDYQKNSDRAAAQAKIEALEKAFEQETSADMEVLAPFRDDPVVSNYANRLQQVETTEHRHMRHLSLPDLVTSAGREQAATLLRRAFRLPLVLQAGRESGAETLRLARELAVAESAKLRAPPWTLTHDTGALELFELLQKQFPPGEGTDDYAYKTACGYYLAGLIQAGRVPEAVAFASRPAGGARIDLPYEVMQALERGGEAAAVWDFLKGWLSRHPAANEWDRFNRLSAQLGRQAELKALIKAMAADGSFDGLNRLKVQGLQADAELATGELAAAIRRLRAATAAPAASPEERGLQLNFAMKLLQLADLQGSEADFASTLAASEALIARPSRGQLADGLGDVTRLLGELTGLGRFSEAARIGGAALQELAAAQSKPAPSSEEREPAVDDYRLQNLLAEQLAALAELGRWPEARALLQDNPGWGVADASELLRETAATRRPLGLYVARLLKTEKQADLARRVLEAQLVATPAVDAVYADYLAIAGAEARPLLAKLIAVDRYEERPLIWRARLELDAGNHAAAAATLQEAINIDPSDGEEGRGDRMRVYAFMSEAMAAKGDREKAAFFADVVKAIRLSETADRWFAIGAYDNAIKLYRQALGIFQDAYCIQSRLAVRLAGEGRMDEAAEHYRRAFELMPDSFGRVESHCFGCEHVFAGKESQGVAEEVFTRMLAARPDKPQLHYLLGYLRQEQDRDAEAARHYRRAVALDPLYLNAWSRLQGLEGSAKLTPAERDDLLLKLLELDPAGRHASPSLSRVTDLARMWRAVTAARQRVATLPAHEKLWELKASAARPAGAPGRNHRLLFEEKLRDPATILLENSFVGAVQAYLAALTPRLDGY